MSLQEVASAKDSAAAMRFRDSMEIVQFRILDLLSTLNNIVVMALQDASAALHLPLESLEASTARQEQPSAAATSAATASAADSALPDQNKADKRIVVAYPSEPALEALIVAIENLLDRSGFRGTTQVQLKKKKNHFIKEKNC